MKSNRINVFKICQCTQNTHAKDTVYPHWRIVVIGIVSGTDVNSERQMQGFNSGTTAWFAWAAAYLSVIKLSTISQYAAKKSLPTGNTAMFVYLKKKVRVACVVWLDLDVPVLSLNKTKQETSAPTAMKFTQVGSLIFMFYEKYSMCNAHSCLI